MGDSLSSLQGRATPAWKSSQTASSQEPDAVDLPPTHQGGHTWLLIISFPWSIRSKPPVLGLWGRDNKHYRPQEKRTCRTGPSTVLFQNKQGPPSLCISPGSMVLGPVHAALTATGHSQACRPSPLTQCYSHPPSRGEQRLPRGEPGSESVGQTSPLKAPERLVRCVVCPEAGQMLRFFKQVSVQAHGEMVPCVLRDA